MVLVWGYCWCGVLDGLVVELLVAALSRRCAGEVVRLADHVVGAVVVDLLELDEQRVGAVVAGGRLDGDGPGLAVDDGVGRARDGEAVLRDLAGDAVLETLEVEQLQRSDAGHQTQGEHDAADCVAGVLE